MIEQEKFKKIKYYKLLYDEQKIDEDTISALASFIDLKSKDGVWEKPKHIIFTQKYIPNHILENLLKIFTPLIKKGIPLKILHQIKFLSEIFIKDLQEDEILSWYKFLKELGIDDLIGDNKGNISEDLGVLCSLYYEEQNSRVGAVITNKVGYDIKTIDKNSNEIRLIEAKGSASTQPIINITANKFSILTQKQNSYVYVISDALLNPLIHIIKGGELLKPKKDLLAIIFLINTGRKREIKYYSFLILLESEKE